MGKYALIMAFTYPRIADANYELQSLPSALVDIGMIHKLCLKMGILPSNITIITDLPPMKKIPSDIRQCNLRMNPYPSDVFICREICQFIENTIRGIEDNSYKNGDSNPEVLFYVSGHGDKIKINDVDHQGIILTDDTGTNLKYLLSKDIFNIIFGNFEIDCTGRVEIPTYNKLRTIKRIVDGDKIISKIESIGIEEHIIVQLSPTVVSPQVSPDSEGNIQAIKPYRSSYLTNRGIPVLTKMLIFIDTCHSEHMTYFPFSYNPKTQEMHPTINLNIDVGIDLPYCVTISSCEAGKTSTQKDSGSSLTRILYLNLMNIKTKLTISQLHYIIYNTKNNIIRELLDAGAAHPIITSTSSLSDISIPFFNFSEGSRREIIEK